MNSFNFTVTIFVQQIRELRDHWHNISIHYRMKTDEIGYKIR